MSTSCPLSHMQDGVDRYLDQGVMPDAFLTALFSNDLIGAFRKADTDNRAAMHEWVRFLVNQVPPLAYGSAEAVQAWCAAFASRREATRRAVEAPMLVTGGGAM